MINLTYHESRYIEETLEDVLTVLDQYDETLSLFPEIEEEVRQALIIVRACNRSEESVDSLSDT